ncbi:MAG: UDP-N-acetylmuramoyl-L-alanyl-D-glutamate--2,6-diaminopimelate ligase [Clostridia bacterium]|nr:UDP-N-acetylmuramoyl-L-alanyl-D-glutamate--2,6-diaminopimelate ligase [Clostridia bacterium]
MRLTQLLKDMIIEEISGDVNVNVEALTHEVAKITKDSLFFCIEGAKFDGHMLAGNAVEKGASVVVTSRKLGLSVTEVIVRNTRRAMSLMSQNFYDNSDKALKIIGVTGTNGKTSTTYILDSILRCAGKKTGIIGTDGIRILNERFEARLTTPDPIELNRVFYDMKACGVEYVIMEVSAHAIALCKVDGISFEVGILTNFSPEHLDFFHDESIYRAVKKSFFTDNYIRNAVVNCDDDLGLELTLKPKVPTVSYGVENPCDAFAIDSYSHNGGSGYIANINDEIIKIKTKLQGVYNLYNTLAAATCAKLLGISNADVAQGISRLEYIEGRNREHITRKGVRIVVDFAHTAQAYMRILELLKQGCKGKLIAVLGCGGDRDRSQRSKIGKISSTMSDIVVLTEDNSRSENVQDIIHDIEAGIDRDHKVITDRKKAIDYAVSCARSGDVVAVLGKGVERYIDRGDTKIEFCDWEYVQSF